MIGPFGIQILNSLVKTYYFHRLSFLKATPHIPVFSKWYEKPTSLQSNCQCTNVYKMYKHFIKDAKPFFHRWPCRLRMSNYHHINITSFLHSPKQKVNSPKYYLSKRCFYWCVHCAVAFLLMVPNTTPQFSKRCPF